MHNHAYLAVLILLPLLANSRRRSNSRRRCVSTSKPPALSPVVAGAVVTLVILTLIFALAVSFASAAIVTVDGALCQCDGVQVHVEAAPSFLSAPRVSGTPVEGRKLVATSGTLYPDSALSYPGSLAGLQWRIADDASGTNATTLSGVTGPVCVVPYLSIRGKWIGCRASGTNTAGTSTGDTIWIGPVLPHTN